MDALAVPVFRRVKMGYSEKGKQGFQKTHGMRKHPLYSVWQRIKTRCYNDRCKDYKDYGGRGITVCEEWRNDFVPFYEWAVKSGWKSGLSIERIDYNGNYCPENCKWIPLAEQSKNRRSVRRITYRGQTHTIAEWSRLTGIPRRTLSLRLDSPNFTLEEAFEKPINKNLARR